MRAISNTSPLLYLYRIGVLDWLKELFEEVWTPEAVVRELDEGRQRGYDVPDVRSCGWIKIARAGTIPSEWIALDLGRGELETMTLGLENPDFVLLLDDLLARRTAQAAGLQVWGTLRILLVGKEKGLTERLTPYIDGLVDAGMWLSVEIRQRILRLAGEG